MITFDMVKSGYEAGIIKLIDGSTVLGDGVVCSIGDNWFYFGGQTAEEYTDVEKYKNDVPQDDIIQCIFEALEGFSTEFEDEYLYYESVLRENGISAQEIELGALTREEVEKYFIEQGRPDVDESWYEEFLNAGEQQPLYDEIVRNNYDLSDVDRWFHLMKVMGLELDWKTASAINNALWEADIETLELNTPEERKRIIQREEGSYLGDLQHVEEQIITEYEAGDVELAQFLLSKSPDLDIEDTFELYAKLRNRIDGDKVLYLKSSGEMYDIGAGEILTDYEMRKLISKYVQLDEFDVLFDKTKESPEVIDLRKSVASLREQLDGVIEFAPEFAPVVSKRLAVCELRLNAALEGVELNLDENDIIDAEHLDCFWYDGYIGSLKYKGYTVDIEVKGDMHCSLLDEFLNTVAEFKNPALDDVYEFIKDDAQLHFLAEQGRVVWSLNNRVSFSVYDKDDNQISTEAFETILDNNVLEAFADVDWVKSAIDEIIQRDNKDKLQHVGKKFVFDDELMINPDFESVNGYLWALDCLVDKLPSSGAMDNINFYADFNVKNKEIKLVTSFYLYTEEGEEQYRSFEVELTAEEKEELIKEINEYCEKTCNARTCLDFVNRVRCENGLCLLRSQTALDEKIKSADNVRMAQQHTNHDTVEHER